AGFDFSTRSCPRTTATPTQILPCATSLRRYRRVAPSCRRSSPASLCTFRVAHVEYHRTFFVHQIHQFLRAHPSPASLGFVADEQRQQHRKNTDENWMISNEFKQLGHREPRGGVSERARIIHRRRIPRWPNC